MYHMVGAFTVLGLRNILSNAVLVDDPIIYP